MHYKRVKSILSAENGMNIYRGCLHNCIYCDSRSKCYQMDHEFEDIEVKENSIELLANILSRKRKKCMIGTGSMSDPYLPLEMEFGFIRRSLELVIKYGFGFTLLTKSANLLRDLDLFKKINEKTKCVIQMTLTTFDEELCKKLEPNVSSTKERVAALNILRDAGIPTIVWLCPILPFINDTVENLAGILDYCIDAKVFGILNFGMGLTLREGNREYYYLQLDRLFPGMKEKYQEFYGNCYQAESPRSKELKEYFQRKCKQNGIETDLQKIFQFLNTFEEKNTDEQLTLF